ncbi:MAG: M48 family metalloprotease [Acidobacteria bacterium]|nr:M48 family metalloprotease [Acidobacteriota bacterium]MBV8890911.1 M48 family metalloprotease [Acidobacteriota bacterium]
MVLSFWYFTPGQGVVSRIFLKWNYNALLLVFLAVPALVRVARADSPSSHPSAQYKTPHTPSQINSNRVKRYDLRRIGQRGIGRGINVYSRDRERQLGQNLAASFDRNTKFVNDVIISEYINRLGQKLVRNSDAEVPFTIKVIDSSDIRAFGLPGGFLYVDSGLVVAADSEAELASMMAHEIAHVAARHATRAATRKDIWNCVAALALFAGPAGVGLEEIEAIAGPLSAKKFSRDAENEADLLGIEYEYAAGYDPQAFVAALEKLHAIEENMRGFLRKIPGYHWATRVPFHSHILRGFTSYPLTEERIRRIQSEIAIFLPNKEGYVLDTSDFQEIKARLLAAQAPVLRRQHPGENSKNGPVLHRTPNSSVDIR